MAILTMAAVLLTKGDVSEGVKPECINWCVKSKQEKQVVECERGLGRSYSLTVTKGGSRRGGENCKLRF